mgnify:CR=1 FL=1
MRLYEIDQALEEALNKVVVDEETGEVTAEPDFELIEKLQMERDQKIENVCRFVKNATSDAKAIAEEIKKLTARKKVLENQADRAKSFVEFALAGEKFESPTVSVTYRTSKSIVVDDLFSIPEEYLRYKEPEADKVAIKAALKAGETVPGAHEEETKSIQIK